MSQEELKEILRLYKDDDIEYYNLCGDLGYDKLLNYINNLKEENQRLNNVLNGIDKILIEHIDECREELNTIYKTEDSEYIAQCSKEFDVIRKNIEMIINKVNELKESDK